MDGLALKYFFVELFRSTSSSLLCRSTFRTSSTISPFCPKTVEALIPPRIARYFSVVWNRSRFAYGIAGYVYRLPSCLLEAKEALIPQRTAGYFSTLEL